MANSPSSKKRARQSEKRRQQNASQRSMVRTYIKKIDVAVASGNYDNAQAAFLTAQPIIDSMVNKGIYPKNRAARIKSTLNGQVKALKA